MGHLAALETILTKITVLPVVGGILDLFILAKSSFLINIQDGGASLSQTPPPTLLQHAWPNVLLSVRR